MPFSNNFARRVGLMKKLSKYTQQLVSFRLSQNNNTIDSPSPKSVFPFFSRHMSNLYKYTNSDQQRNQNLKPYLTDLLFMHWHIMFLPLNLGMCPSVD